MCITCIIYRNTQVSALHPCKAGASVIDIAMRATKNTLTYKSILGYLSIIYKLYDSSFNKYNGVIYLCIHILWL
jgi:hypothetical protein